MRMHVLTAALALSAFASGALAAMRTVTLSVPDMYCEVCPITVKKALQKVPGVTRVEVSFEKKEAQVSFDDAKVSVKVLTEATARAGYPSTEKAAK